MAASKLFLYVANNLLLVLGILVTIIGSYCRRTFDYMSSQLFYILLGVAFVLVFIALLGNCAFYYQNVGLLKTHFILLCLSIGFLFGLFLILIFKSGAFLMFVHGLAGNNTEEICRQYEMTSPCSCDCAMIKLADSYRVHTITFMVVIFFCKFATAFASYKYFSKH